MFAPRYFPDRYFARRYFPASGAALTVNVSPFHAANVQRKRPGAGTVTQGRARATNIVKKHED